MTKSLLHQMHRGTPVQGMRRMREDGLEKVKAGLTSLAEVARLTGGTV